MNSTYWEKRIRNYEEMIAHIKEQRQHANPADKPRLNIELERLFLEVNVIREHLDA